MTFDVGSLAASLRIDGMQQFENDLQRAGDKLDQAGRRGQSFGQLGEAAVRKAAGATVALTGAATAYLSILTRTGVQYNSLQQNSRAALTTLLGGAEAANAQMDKLDAFAKNSPFAKDVFVGAQQQLISFGVETRKVIPYLDAVQNAIASAGGSNADLDAVVTTMAKIQSSSKITAQDFIEFGNRGINAADLIGSRMGKTGAEIREAVTKGTLGATEALDALTEGMKARFGGATDLIKEQWSGAVDRIKAAQRDLGAAIAEPFVSAKGGGMAVMWGNQVADVLRAIEKQAVPVMEILTRRGAPLFAGLTAGLDDAQRSIQNFDVSKIEVSLDKLATYGPAIGVVAGALAAVGTSVGPLGALFGSVGLKINPVLGAFMGLAAASPELRQGLSEVWTAAKPLGPVLGDVARVMSGALSQATSIAAQGLGVVADGAELLVGLIEKIPAPILAGATSFLLLKSATSGLDLTAANAGVSTFISTIRQSDAVRAFNAGLTPTTSLLAGVGQAGHAARAGVLGLGDALKTAFLSNPVGIALTAVSAAIGLWAAANAEAQAKVQEHKNKVAELKGTLDATDSSLTDTTRSMLAQVAATDEMAAALSKTGTSGKSFVTALSEGGAAAKVFEENILSSAKSTEEYERYSSNWQTTADKLGVSLDTLVRSSLGFTDAQKEVQDALRASGGSYTSLQDDLENTERGIQSHLSAQHQVTAAYEAQRAALSEAQREHHRMNQAIADARTSMTDAGRATEDYAAASTIATDQTAALEERVRALKTAYDILTGGASSAAEAQAQVDAANLSLAEGFAKVDENGNSAWATAINLADEATRYVDTSTRYGQELFRALQQQQDSTLQASIVARDTAINNGQSASEAFAAAKAAAEQYNAGLSQTLTDAGLVGEAHQRLYEAWSIDPETAAFTVTDNGTMDEVMLQAIQLAAQIESTPDKTIIIDEPLSPEVRKRLQDLGFTITDIPGTKNIQVSQTGADEADRAITHAARNRETTIKVNPYLSPMRNFENSGILYAPGGGGLSGNLYSGGVAQAFASGGFTSGFYKAPPGQDAIHKFAERELAWEAYISPKPGFEAKNIKIAMTALDRLGHPVVPVSALKGIPGFASGRMVDVSPSSVAVSTPSRSGVPRRRARTAPIAETINMGVESSYNDLLNLVEVLDDLDRGI